MSYSIGEVANTTNIAISTLRYYDREGMFPNMGRTEGGMRVFSEKEVDTLRVIECLKMSGMSIKDIKTLPRLVPGRGCFAEETAGHVLRASCGSGKTN